ncbi:MAG: 3'(2'),5'-bisphosphate nucleotidase [Planctomycetes bacterium]|nr:3'(2'),5'-bisphosphate nucleotidase [Planctomycetota bacterium]
MPLKKFETELRIALSAVRTATGVCRNIRAAISPDVLEKKDRSPVTVADFASQAVICRLLNQSFPDDSIVAEEDSTQLATAGNQSFLDRIDTELKRVGHDADADAIRDWIDLGGSQPNQNRFWTLDPIDGTKGFLRGGQYVVALALLIDQRVDVAVLGCPNLRHDPDGDGQLGTLVYAVRGEGCWATALDDTGDPVPLCVSETAEVSQARFCESVEAGHSDHGIAANVAASLGAHTVRRDYRHTSVFPSNVEAGR